MPHRTDDRDPRARIVDSAAGLLREHGRAAVTTRRVAELAGVQAPVIYRLFGDKEGLLDAVADRVMGDFAEAKRAAVSTAGADWVDPVADLRTGWDMTIDFGLTNPELFVLYADPLRASSPSAQAGVRLLAERVHRIAMAGRLRMAEEKVVELIHAAGTGAVLAILAQPAEQRDRRLADVLFAGVLGQILTEVQAGTEMQDSGPIAPAVALRGNLPELTMFSDSERALLAEWLDRIAEQG